MPVPTSYTNPTGFTNVLTSINKWLETNVPPANAADFTYYFLANADTAVFPRVSVNQLDNQEPGVNAYAQLVFPHGTNMSPPRQEQGRPNVIVLEINIYTDSRKNPAAKKSAFQIRDRISRGLANAGISKDLDDSVILPPIAVLDYENSDLDTGIVATVLIEDAQGLGARYFPPPTDTPTVHRVQILGRIEWYELS